LLTMSLFIFSCSEEKTKEEKNIQEEKIINKVDQQNKDFEDILLLVSTYTRALERNDFTKAYSLKNPQFKKEVSLEAYMETQGRAQMLPDFVKRGGSTTISGIKYDTPQYNLKPYKFDVFPGPYPFLPISYKVKELFLDESDPQKAKAVISYRILLMAYGVNKEMDFDGKNAFIKVDDTWYIKDHVYAIPHEHISGNTIKFGPFRSKSPDVIYNEITARAKEHYENKRYGLAAKEYSKAAIIDIDKTKTLIPKELKGVIFPETNVLPLPKTKAEKAKELDDLMPVVNYLKSLQPKKHTVEGEKKLDPRMFQKKIDFLNKKLEGNK
ncbi:MAG: hypothetical protein HQK84_11940, partial [Nitrospinae bacterium]|nr:hypothetical protein [Nitrospinota bacterium]